MHLTLLPWQLQATYMECDALQIQICFIGLFAMSTRYYYLQMRDYVSSSASIYTYTHTENSVAITGVMIKYRTMTFEASFLYAHAAI